MDIKTLKRFDGHSHSMFSNFRLIDSINRPKDMILKAYELGMSGIALTDHETVAGHVEWLKCEKELKKAGKIPEDFKCACGNEIYLVDDRTNIERYWHYILIAKNTEGHRALRELSSTAWYNGFSSRGMMRVPTEKAELEAIVRKYPNTLIATTACFRKGTLVKTKQGDKKIEDITNNDYILNMYGEWERVNFPTSRIFNGNGRIITFLENDIPTICTDSHKFLVTTNNKIQKYKSTGKIPYEWIEAKNLITKRGNTKHILLYPIEKTQYNNRNIIKKSEWKNYLRDDKYLVKKGINPEIKITNEVMRLFGLWLGDGSISIDKDKKYYCVNFTFSFDEFNYYWDSFFEKASKEIGIDWTIKKREENHRVDVCTRSVEAVELFYYLFGNNKADTKYVPNRLTHISRELDFNLFMGYQFADGYFRTRQKDGYSYGEFCSASISERLTRDFQNILKTIGIRSSITVGKEKTINGVHHRQSYYLSGSNKAWTLINKKSIITNNDILNCMNVAIQHDNKKHIEINGVLYKKVYIKNIEEIKMNEEVHCLNVDSHSFCCNGVIVHNCLGGELPHFVAELVKAEQAQDENEIHKWKMEIHRFMTWNIDLFGDDFYIEIAAADVKDQIRFNERVKSIAAYYNRKVVIGSDAHYLTAKERSVHKAYLNSKDGEREVDGFYTFAHMMDNEEAYANLRINHTEEEFAQFCANSMEIYDKIGTYDIFKKPIIPRVDVREYDKHIPADITVVYPTLYQLFTSDNVQERYWVNECFNALEAKNLVNATYLNALETEARVIKVVGEKLGNCLYEYFNTFQHMINLFWEQGSIVGPGRGSAVCFLSNYLLGITQLDPLQWGLKYWRLT